MNNSKVLLRIVNNSSNSKVIYNSYSHRQITSFKNIKNNNNIKSYISYPKSHPLSLSQLQSQSQSQSQSISSSSVIFNNVNKIKYNKSYYSTQVNEKKDEIKQQEPVDSKQDQKIENNGQIQQQEPQQPLENKESQQSVDNKDSSNNNSDQQQQQQQQDTTNNDSNNNKDSSNNNSDQQQQQQNSTNTDKPKTLKEKILSKIKWTLILGSITGSIGFLFYESYLRNTLPYRMTMDLLDRDVDVLRSFGGHITGIKWYKCFMNPIFGWVQNEEGGMASWTYLRIPITRYVAPPLPKPKEGEPEIVPITLPEDALFSGYDGGVQVGIAYVRMVKKSAHFFDWSVEDLQVHCDNNQVIKVVDSEKMKVQFGKRRF